MRAAEQVGPAARPLPLFYALSQGGRAIAAAHGNDPWQLRGHGLHLKDQELPLLDRRLAPDDKASSSFRRVSEITASGILASPVTLGALCAALPDLANSAALIGDHPRALFVRAIRQSSGAFITMGADVDAYVFNLPDEVVSTDTPQHAIAAYLSHYPSAAGWELSDPPRRFPSDGTYGAGAILRWRVAEDVNSPNEPERQDRVREVAPQYLYTNRQWCLPEVAPGTVLTPLMGWWALLFSLSMVARYEPDAWIAALAIDESPIAVALEDALEDALEVVPHLLLNALLPLPLLLRPISEREG